MPAAGGANGADNGSGSRDNGGGLVLAAVDRPVEVCVQLPGGVEVLLVEPARNPDEDNCAVEVYYQVGLSSTDLRLRVLTDLVEQVVSEALYDTLRTKQQLGYTVSSGARLTHGVTGFCVVVVSAAFDAGTVEQRVEAFLHDYQHTALQAMGAEEFARHKSSLASNKLQSDTSLGQEGDRAWEQVFTNRYEFVTREQEAAVLQELTLQELQSFYASYISPASPSRRKLCIHITPRQKKHTPNAGDKQQQQQGAGVPQEHVQHEFGVLHPHGEHQQHGKQQQQQHNHDEAAAAAAGSEGGGGSGDTPKSKRVRRQAGNSSEAAAGAGGEGGGGGAGMVAAPAETAAAAGVSPGSQLSAVQAAPVQVLAGGVEGFRASAARYGVYRTVQPELLEAQAAV